MTRLRRLTVMQLIPALDTGGAERSAVEIARGLVAAGHRSIVVSSGGKLAEELIAEGSEHVEMPIAKKSLGTLRQVSPLRELIRREKPDIVHARSRVPAWLGWLAVRGITPRPHFVTTAHGLNTPGWYSAIMTRGERVVCVSNTVRDHLLHHYPRTLSGGEQQRVSLARAFVVQPSLLLADEPTGSLDVATGAKIIDLMFAMHKEQGTTLVLVTHDPQLAARCERQIVLNAGRLA